MTQIEARPEITPFQRTVDALDANFGVAPRRRAAHAKGLVLTGTFTPTPEAGDISRAGHLAGGTCNVVARFSNFPGGASHPDAAGESNPRGLAVQFRLPDGSTTDLLAHSIDGFPGRTVDDFADFLTAIAPGGDAPGYLAGHPAAANFVAAIQSHGMPVSYATLPYFPVNAFCFQNAEGATVTGRYTWTPRAGSQFLTDEQAAEASDDYLTEELRRRLARQPITFLLELTIAGPDDITDDANSTWPDTRRRVALGSLTLDGLIADSETAQEGLFFDPVRLIDGITTSDDPLLAGRSLTYPISLTRRHHDV